METILMKLDEFGNWVVDQAWQAGQAVLDTAEKALNQIVPAAHAAIDLEAVETGLTAAQTSGESVGTLVIGVVAGLAVVGVIIAMVRKL